MNTKSRVTTKDGQTFPSIREACKQLGVSRSTVIKRVKAGVDLIDAIDPNFSRANVSPITIDGKKFKRKLDAAIHFGIPYQKFMDRLASGWSPEETVELATRARVLDIEQKNRRIEDFAKTNGLSIPGAQTRLRIRRKRFREWLELKHIDNHAHINAIHVRDSQNRWFYSIAQAAKYHQKSISKIRKITTKTNEDLIYGERFSIDSDLEVSFDSILLLLSHPNVLERETGNFPLRELRFDNNIAVNIDIKKTKNYVTSTLSIDDEALVSLSITNNQISTVTGSLFKIEKGKLLTPAQSDFQIGCSRKSIVELAKSYHDAIKRPGGML